MRHKTVFCCARLSVLPLIILDCQEAHKTFTRVRIPLTPVLVSNVCKSSVFLLFDSFKIFVIRESRYLFLRKDVDLLHIHAKKHERLGLGTKTKLFQESLFLLLTRVDISKRKVTVSETVLTF
jgi:hypothetical protein